MFSEKQGQSGISSRVRILAAQSLGLVGMAASVATIYATPAEGIPQLGCAIKALDCGTALTSQFSKIAGIPLGVFGLFYFVFWSLNLRAFHRTGDPVYRFSFSWITLIGAVGSLTLGTIMFFVLRAPCLYCLIIHLSNLSTVILLWPLMQFRPSSRPAADNLWHFASLTAISVLAAITLFLASENRNLQAQIHDLKAPRTPTLF